MRALELLAPAKNLECGIAAIDHGADAVYIGASRFGARVAAGNSVSDIKELCDYARPFGVKVYVTVNTILYDDELAATRLLLQELAEAGVSAILVQDMAIMGIAGSVPESNHNSPSSILNSQLKYHASTQTDNRTPEKVRWLHDLGFSRAVLARELSADEIANIHQAVPEMELEVFVHGALCVSYSGLCYASQHCFGRSANRGECAQFCRMRFSLIDADGREVERDRYLLSLKDLNQSAHLEQLVEAGATSFKIEGRLKDINYVKNVTAAYSQCLNDMIRRHPEAYCRSSWGECAYTFKPDLNRTFNRGYTSYFLNGRQRDIASFDTPKAVGEFVGTVKEVRGDSFNVAGLSSFSNGDGLCFVSDDRQLQGFRANKVVANRIYPYRMPSGLRPGVRLYRNNDQEFERLLSKQSAERRVEVTMALRAYRDDDSVTGFQLTISDGCHMSSVRMPADHQAAQKPQHEQIVRELSKLGNTPYRCLQVDVPADFGYFIPASRLAELRRLAVSRFQHTDWLSDSGIPAPPSPSPSAVPPAYEPSYLYNVSNMAARTFYEAQGISPQPAYELKEARGPVMQCRHCIRYSLGYCVRHGGKRPSWREPLSLVLGDGRCFRLEFDCQHCQMNVFVSE